ncbi:MAG: tRNA-dihydrouridine synthase, partial [Salinivirgaceae bacterium]
TNFWVEKTGPFFILAPMEDVTDTVFRELVLSVSNPSVLKVLFTEFTSVDGLLDSRGHDAVAQRLLVSESEKLLLHQKNIPLVAQIWGNEPEKFFQVAQFLTSLNRFQGIDINMGCPVKKVVQKNTCSALIQLPELAKEIIAATQEGSGLPVSVKTRIGFNSVVTERWISHLLASNLAAITIHGRTQKQQSDGLADWNEIGKAIPLRNQLSAHTQIIGNGDVDNYTDGMEKISTHQLDGVMVGRGIFKNPWLFNSEPPIVNTQTRMQLLTQHITLFEQFWGKEKNFNILKRFFKIYINGYDGAAALRAQLMECKNCAEALLVLAPH